MQKYTGSSAMMSSRLVKYMNIQSVIMVYDSWGPRLLPRGKLLIQTDYRSHSDSFYPVTVLAYACTHNLLIRETFS